ncbi:MAG TPA: RNA-binding domain-containing protein [Bacteroidales bacterium]|nr:RNA-binding domain-containing protein [Bacteroidales bacterium]
MSLQKDLFLPPNLHLDFFKLDPQGNVPPLFPTICAFLNTEGGSVIIGVSRDKEFQSLTESSLIEFRKTVKERSEHEKDYLNPSYGFIMEIDQFKDGHFLIIDVPRSPVLHYSGQALYKRVGSETIRVSEPQDIMELYSIRRKNTVSETLPFITKADLDLRLIEKAKSIAREVSSTHQWLTMSDDEIIHGSNLSEYDESSGEIIYCLATVLLFGKDETIRRVLPAYKLDIFVRKNDIDRWDDRKTFSTNLIDTQTGALNFVKGHLPEAFYQDGAQRKDLRDLIFREIISNVIIHREYSNALPTEIIIYKDRVEAKNPNIIYKKGLLELGKFRHYPKNPLLRKFFNVLGWADEAGSGVRNVTKFLDIYSRGAVPLFQEDDMFITVIPLKGSQIQSRYIFYLDLFEILTEEISEERINQLKDLSINTKLSEIYEKENFISLFIGTLLENEGKLIGFNLLKKKMLEKWSNKMEGTLLEFGGNFIEKKGKILMRILIGLIVEMSIDEALTFSGFESKESFRENYLSVLRKNDLIKLTIPEKPNDPNQKYIITEKGKKLIGGMPIA